MPLSEVQDSLDFLQSCCRTAYSSTSGTETFCVQLLLLVTGKAKSNRILGFVLTQSGWAFLGATTAFSSSTYISLLEMTVKLRLDQSVLLGEQGCVRFLKISTSHQELPKSTSLPPPQQDHEARKFICFFQDHLLIPPVLSREPEGSTVPGQLPTCKNIPAEWASRSCM